MENLDILLVNDDGFEAEGIDVMFTELTEAGHNVTLVAPKEQQSGVGTLINVDKVFQPTEVVNFEENKWYVDASPTVTTIAGLDYVLAGEEPDLVISGINEGANVGADTAISSGTVSAAVAAIQRDLPTIAVSAGTGFDEEAYSQAYEVGAEFVLEVIDQLQQATPEASLLPDGVGLSINIPNEFPESVEGIDGVVYTELDEVSTVNFAFGELPGDVTGAGLIATGSELIPPEEITNPISEGQQYLSGKITITPIDGDWSGGETERVNLSDRLSEAPEDVTPSPLNILVTNDDGFDADGIEILYESLVAAGHNVTLIAPKEQQSGQGTVLNVESIFQPTEVVNYAENKWYVDGGPRKTTWAALDYILPAKPDLVISGINEGENIGPGGAVSSGTVSSAVTALLRNVPAIAISAGIDLADPTAVEEAYTDGAEYINQLIAQLQATQGSDPEILPEGLGLSVNIPARFPEGVEEIQGVKYVSTSNTTPFNIDFGEVPGGVGLRFFPNDVPPEVDPISEGDQFLSGFITVLPINGNWTASADLAAEVKELIEPLLTREIPVTVFGTNEADLFDSENPDSQEFLGEGQNLFTGGGDDLVDVTFASGGNRIDLGSGNDQLFAGSNNRVLGGSGEDQFFLGSGDGNNVVTGDRDADHFWVVTDSVDLPSSLNIITDFTPGEDRLGFANTGLDFADLTISQQGSATVISALNTDIVKLLNTQVSEFSNNDVLFAS